MIRMRGAAALSATTTGRTGRLGAALLLAASIVVGTGGQALAHPGPHPGQGGGPAAAASHPGAGSYGGGWRPLTPIAGGPRQEHSVVAVGHEVYVLGGIVPDPEDVFVTTGRMEVYDVRRRTWSETAPMPVPMNHPNAAVVDGRIYVLGGLDGGESWDAIPDSFVYDPRTDTWSDLAPVPAGLERGSAAVGVDGTRILLAGGMRVLAPVVGGLHDTVSTVSSYDVTTGRWTALPDLPEGRDHVGGAVVDDTFFVIGGRDRGQVNVRDTVYAMDLDTQQWSERAPMPTARGGIAAAAVGRTIYTFGGEGSDVEGSNGVFAETEGYDTARDRWSTLAPMPVPRHGTAAVAVGSTIYIPGGGDVQGGAPMDVNDSYRPHAAWCRWYPGAADSTTSPWSDEAWSPQARPSAAPWRRDDRSRARAGRPWSGCGPTWTTRSSG